MQSQKLGESIPLEILIAEDNLVNQIFILGLLEEIGYVGDLVSNGLEALNALKRKDYDVIFMDMQMPEMDGMEATRQIVKNWPEEKRPKIIAITSNALQGDREQCLEAGMDDYISKPILKEELIHVLNRWGGGIEANTPIKNKISEKEIIDQKIFSTFTTEIQDEFIQIYMKQVPSYIKNIKQYIADGKILEMKKEAHRLKGSCLVIGANKLAYISEVLQNTDKNKNMDELVPILTDLDEVYEKVSQELTKYKTNPDVVD